MKWSLQSKFHNWRQFADCDTEKWNPGRAQLSHWAENAEIIYATLALPRTKTKLWQNSEGVESNKGKGAWKTRNKITQVQTDNPVSELPAILRIKMIYKKIKKTQCLYNVLSKLSNIPSKIRLMKKHKTMICNWENLKRK